MFPVKKARFLSLAGSNPAEPHRTLSVASNPTPAERTQTLTPSSSIARALRPRKTGGPVVYEVGAVSKSTRIKRKLQSVSQPGKGQCHM